MGAYLLALAPWSVVFWLLTALGLSCLAATCLTLPEPLKPARRIRQSPLELAASLGKLFTTRCFIVPAAVGAVGNSAIFAFISASPFVMMGLYGLSRTSYAWTFALISLGTGLFAQLNLLILKKLTARWAMTLGLGGMSVLGAALAMIVLMGGPLALPILLVLLFLVLAMVPMIGANSTALAMSASGHLVGGDSSLIEVLQFGLAGLVSFLVSVFHDETMRPMVIAILACAMVGSLILIAERLASSRC
jgi:DHA1 family bicyclomycin/chloramphenicol resistance-like MFS transporter